ncbi:hypothetical protein BJV74DRAFT_882990 [Russula compacta]|nr:hypothetical protein BJV74DRAFT_882990 [Russula compacta]
MASAAPSLGLHMPVEGENIIIKRRRKRLVPPDIVLSDGGRLLDYPPASDGTRDGRPSSGDPSTPCGRAHESSPVLSQICSRSALAIPSHEGQPVTVHEFLQDTASKTRSKYGRRNRLATVKLDVNHRGEDDSPTPTPPCDHDVETRNDRRRISAYPHIQPKHLPRPVPHPRRRKQFTKSLAQRLFEADIFSSGTSSRPTAARDSAHTSTRRPLQFVTSLNLTPSLESRVYQRNGRQGKGKGGSPAAADSEVLAPVASVPALGPSPKCPTSCAAAASAQRKPSSRNWNGSVTQRVRTGGSGVVLSSGRKAFRTRGGKQSRAQVPPI